MEAIEAEAVRVFGAGRPEAAEIAAFGQWIVGQCGAPDSAVRRRLRVVHRQAGEEADGSPLAEGQAQSLDAIARSFQPR